MLFAGPGHAITDTDCFVLISLSLFSLGSAYVAADWHLFGLAMVDFGSRLYDTVTKDAL